MIHESQGGSLYGLQARGRGGDHEVLILILRQTKKELCCGAEFVYHLMTKLWVALNV